MKSVVRSILCILILILVIKCEKDETQVIINDNNFLNALIELGIDTDSDSIISSVEAEAITYLYVNQKNISDMTGIEKFVNLETLLCYSNQLNNLDISQNSSLISLDCSHNQLTTLDVSRNTTLEGLICSYNRLTSLDVSNNTSLDMGLGGHYDCFLEIENMPDLEKVCVWRIPFPPTGFLLCADGSPNVYFTD